MLHRVTKSVTLFNVWSSSAITHRSGGPALGGRELCLCPCSLLAEPEIPLGKQTPIYGKIIRGRRDYSLSYSHGTGHLRMLRHCRVANLICPGDPFFLMTPLKRGSFSESPDISITTGATKRACRESARQVWVPTRLLNYRLTQTARS